MKASGKPQRLASKRLFGSLGVLAAFALVWLGGSSLLGWPLTPSFGEPFPGSLRDGLQLALQQKARLLLDAATPPHWVNSPSQSSIWPWQSSDAIVLARNATDGNRDLFWVRAQISSRGGLVKLLSVHNLTQTSAADESGLVGTGPLIAWQVGTAKRVYRVEFAALQGAARLAHTDPPMPWGRLAHLQRQLTNFQETGQMMSIARRSFKLEPVASRVSLSFETEAGSPTQLSLQADNRLTLLPTSGGSVTRGARYVLELPRVSARPPSLVPWTVDRIRALSWFGSDRMQWLKAVAYRALDWVDEKRDSNNTEPWKLADDLGAMPLLAPASSRVARKQGADRWPPQPVPTVVDPPAPGEGQWRSLQEDRFLRHSPGLPPPFTTTFVRPDQERLDTRVVIVLWDPRRVALDFAAGTREPKSATGEIGTGLIPRDPENYPRLIGAFNGAFQTSHGNWGAQAHGKLYVPPQPYAATIARFSDSSVGFGTWSSDTTVPDNIRAFRQNLTPLVSNSQFNLYERTWWGGVPNGWTDDTRTVRSGICETQDKNTAYFYGERVDHEHLARAMMLARCRYGIHLDMNQGHTGFEFYSVGAKLSPLEDNAIDDSWQAQGTVPQMASLRFRSRKLFRTMPLMNFPRYIHRQTRDFFYLTERITLPPPRIAGAFSKAVQEGQWEVPLKTASGTPRALVTTSLRPDVARPETKVRVAELDLTWLTATLSPTGTKPTVLSILLEKTPAAGAVPGRRLWIQGRRAGMSLEVPAGAIVVATQAPEDSRIISAWGLLPANKLAYAEVVTGLAPPADRVLLERLLHKLGCTEVLTTRGSSLAIRGLVDLAGHPVSPIASDTSLRIRFVRDEWAATRPLFPDTPVVGPGVWYYLQH